MYTKQYKYTYTKQSELCNVCHSKTLFTKLFKLENNFQIENIKQLYTI